MLLPETPQNNSSFIRGLFLSSLRIFILLFTVSVQSQNISVELSSEWRFRKAGDAEWMNAKVPGTVHTDLLLNKKIPDPFFGDNEKKLQWIDTCEWEYETWFNVNDSVLQRNHAELVFEGLDTYAKVFLNDRLMLSADNMFRTWIVDCKKYLLKERNHLLIRFEPASIKGKAEAKKMPFTLPGDEKVYTRKAQYQYGWDWGPRFVTCGIWRSVKINFWNSFRLNDVHVTTEQLTDSVAHLIAEVNLTVEKATSVFFKVVVENQSRDSFYFDRTIKPDEKISNLLFDIKKPKRWWSNGLGDASVYRISVRATDPFGQSQERSVSTGLRTIQLIQESDARGKSFYFKLNGIPVFMKGANWIPADNFLPRVTKEKYRQLLFDARNANMNMLRVWGGGVYEDDSFYDLCDSLGILVWQDFMFACAMYPGDTPFLENVGEEISENIIRLRNHPCIALWCGNNEIDEGWKNWGWQKQFRYSEKDSATIWKNYLKLFHEAIPQKIIQLDPARTYWESSPSIGWGHQESLLQGDSHYWGVWWGLEPFETYLKKTGRFMSEYGFQGMPSMRSIESFTSSGERNLKSAEIKNHQKHPTGFETIDHYMNDWYKNPKDFDSYVYVSQLLQAEGMIAAIEAHRSAKPYCMGTLYWQLNDCWPVTSWSSIDHSGSWKALHYAVRESYKKYVITVVDTAQFFNVRITSDDTAFVKATLALAAVDFSGNILWRDSAFAYLSQEQSTLVYKSNIADLSYAINPFRAFIKLQLVRNGEILATKIYYFKKPKELLLEKPAISYSLTRQEGEVFISLSSNMLAKNLFLDLKEDDAHFSENYFDLLPLDTRTVSFYSTLTDEEIREKLIFRSLFDTY